MSQSPSSADSHAGSAPTEPRARNIYGRRPGRGLRPYLIVLKILSVACFFGGLMAVLAGVLLGAEPQDVDGWRQQVSVVHRIYSYVIIPGVAAALVLGTLLFSTIWQAMIRMRWFVVKMVLVLLAVPALHLYLRMRMLALKATLAQPHPDLSSAADLRDELIAGTLLAIAFAVAAIILGRVKPRLGQDYGRTFGKPGGASVPGPCQPKQ